MVVISMLVIILAGCGDASDASSGGDSLTKDNGKKGGGSSAEGAPGFNVTFDPQGGEWTINDSDAYWKNVINADGTVNLPDIYIERSGMLLLGWYDRPQPAKNISRSEAESADDSDEETQVDLLPDGQENSENPPYLAASAKIPDEGIFTRNIKLSKNTTLYAWWQELAEDSVIITFVPYWTNGARGFKRQALAKNGYKIEKLPRLKGGPEHYHAVDDKNQPSNTVWFTQISDGDVFSGYSTENTTVYGHWVGNEYTVTFDFNGGENSAGEPSSDETYTYSIDHPNTVTLNSGKTPSPPDGYDGFLGWFTEQKANINIDTDTYAALPSSDDKTRFIAGVTPVEGNITVYALWQNRPNDSRKITFRPYENGDITSMYAKLDGEEYKLDGAIPSVGQRPHYTPVDGKWYYHDDGGAEHELTASTDIPGDITAYAKWKGNTYTVTFDKQNGSADLKQTVTYPVNKLTTLETIQKEGTGSKEHYHSDTKWYSGGGEFTVNTEITGDITVTPNWEGNVYSLEYHSNDGTGTPHTTVTRTYPAAIASFPAAPARADWAFNGWYDTPAASGGIQLQTGDILTADKKVYARWDAGTVAITGITAKYGSVNAKVNETISGDTLNYTVSIPKFVDEPVIVSITAISSYGAPVISTPSVTMPLNSYSTSGGSIASFTVITPNGAFSKTYTIKFTKDSTNKQMAAGGNKIDFIKTGSGVNATWSEVHTFTSTGSHTLKFDLGRYPANLTGKALIAGGGGGGGGSGTNDDGGGGGSGGVALSKSVKILDTTNITVGGGGAGGAGNRNGGGKRGVSGGDSSYGSVKAHGGGGGGAGNSSEGRGLDGGSGGGGGAGSGTATFAGGKVKQNSDAQGFTFYGAVGAASNSGVTGGGGGSANFTSDISGANATYGKGGGSNKGKNGNDGFGDGGGGGAGGSGGPGGKGGSGIVIVNFKFSE
jgi:uncharacterized repeat protein (TIGR02543 family)